jgi:hypothetical protein
MSILYSLDQKVWNNANNEQVLLVNKAIEWFNKNKKVYTDNSNIKIVPSLFEVLDKNFIFIYPDDTIGYIKYSIPKYMRMKAENDIFIKDISIKKGSTYYVDTTDSNKIIIGFNGSINPPYTKEGKPMI